MMAKQYQYGRRSREQLATCHDDLQKIMHLTLAWSIVDFGIVQGVRAVQEQLQLFLAGKSRLDPRDPEQAKKALVSLVTKRNSQHFNSHMIANTCFQPL